MTDLITQMHNIDYAMKTPADVDAWISLLRNPTPSNIKLVVAELVEDMNCHYKCGNAQKGNKVRELALLIRNLR